MKIDTKNLISISMANQNFSSVARKVDSLGNVIILKNNKPKYIISNFEEMIELTDNEKIELIAKRILKEHKYAFEELGK